MNFGPPAEPPVGTMSRIPVELIASVAKELGLLLPVKILVALFAAAEGLGLEILELGVEMLELGQLLSVGVEA